MAFEPPTEYNSAIMVNKSFQIVSPTVAELTEANPILAYNSNLAQTAATTATTQANAAATSAQTAQEAAKQATEISDPEGWRTNTRAMITDLGNSKSNIGMFNFGTRGGCLQTTGNPMYGVLDQSYCMTLELGKDWNLNAIPTPWLNFSGDYNYYNRAYYGVGWQLQRSNSGLNRLSIGVGDGQSTGMSFGSLDLVENIFGGTNSAIQAGKYVICLCIHIGNGTTSDVSTAKVYINGALAYTYTTSTIINTNSVKWTQNSKVGFFDIGNTHLTTNFATNGCFIGKASRFAVFNFDMSAAGAPYSVADYYNGRAIPVALQSSTAEKRCIVASSDYAIARNSTTKLVKDITGNGNDLTVYGDVIGDKDAAVAAFVDELKTQISQNS